MNTTQSKQSSLPIETPLKYTSFHPSRPQFLSISLTGDLTTYNLATKRSTHVFPIRATTACWWNSRIIAVCEDLLVRSISLEENIVTNEFRINAPATSICISGEGRMILGLRTGTCEVWECDGSKGWSNKYETIVGRGVNPILNAQWVLIPFSLDRG